MGSSRDDGSGKELLAQSKAGLIAPTDGRPDREEPILLGRQWNLSNISIGSVVLLFPRVHMETLGIFSKPLECLECLKLWWKLQTWALKHQILPHQTALYSYCFHSEAKLILVRTITENTWAMKEQPLSRIQTLPAEQTLTARFSQSSDGEPASWTRRVAAVFLLILTKRKKNTICTLNEDFMPDEVQESFLCSVVISSEKAIQNITDTPSMVPCCLQPKVSFSLFLIK